MDLAVKSNLLIIKMILNYCPINKKAAFVGAALNKRLICFKCYLSFGCGFFLSSHPSIPPIQMPLIQVPPSHSPPPH